MGLTRDDGTVSPPLADFAGPGRARTSASASTTSASCSTRGRTCMETAAPGEPRADATWRRSRRAARDRGRRCPSATRATTRRTTSSYDEADLLDAQDCDAWLALLTDDIRYLMPVRVTTAHDAGDSRGGHGALRRGPVLAGKRVARFATEHAWTEDPPSRIRHFITNVRCFEGATDDELIAEKEAQEHVAPCGKAGERLIALSEYVLRRDR